MRLTGKQAPKNRVADAWVNLAMPMLMAGVAFGMRMLVVVFAHARG